MPAHQFVYQPSQISETRAGENYKRPNNETAAPALQVYSKAKKDVNKTKHKKANAVAETHVRSSAYIMDKSIRQKLQFLYTQRIKPLIISTSLIRSEFQGNALSKTLSKASLKTK